jgi:nucleoside-diphosphate kinase
MAGMERTLVILKPDAVQRRLIGRIVTRFEEKGLQIVGLKMMRISEELARRNYGVHEGKDFYKPLIRFMTSGPVVVLTLQGVNVVEIIRRMMGKTFGSQSEPGTLRGDFGVSNRFNLVHGSDSPETARREIELFFAPGELSEWEPTDLKWVYDLSGKAVV